MKRIGFVITHIAGSGAEKNSHTLFGIKSKKFCNRRKSIYDK